MVKYCMLDVMFCVRPINHLESIVGREIYADLSTNP